MKILFWGENFLPFVGGAEILLSQLIPALAQRGIEAHVVASRHRPDLPDYETWRKIPVHRLPFREALMGNLRAHASIRDRLLQLYRDIDPDLIHIHSTGPSLFFEMQTHRACAAPRLLTVHAFFSYPPKEDGYFRKYLPRVDFLTGVSRRMLEMALALCPGKTPPHQAVYNGIEPPLSRPEPTAPSAETVLYLGRLSREKGVDLILRAFERISARRPQARLWIAGDGTERKSLEALAQSLGLNERVAFLGQVPPDRVYSLLENGRFLVMPSRVEEGLGLSALQAAHLGRPTIGARCGGLPEIVRHDETGLLFEAESWEGLAEAMERLLADPALCERLGGQARELVRKEFDFTAMVDAYERIYRQLAPGK